MISKSFEFKKININDYNYYLFYGENNGLKDEFIESYFKTKFKGNHYNYEENIILKNKDSFFDEVFTKSFFDDEKLIIIKQSTSKIIPIVEELIEKKIHDIFVVLIADKLEKKSKLRNMFEKNKNTICVPFYLDNYQTLFYKVDNFFKEKKIPISSEIINAIINRTNGDRLHLKNEMEKIEYYSKGKKKINLDEVLKLINLVENNDFNDLINACLSKNEKKLKYIINENNFSNEDTILIIRIILSKVKRLLKIKNEMNINKNIENILLNFKPPIFWKDKDILKQQINHYSKENLEILIKELSEIELQIKKNYQNSVNMTLDFILNEVRRTSN
tara:strand:+ start:54 stop:1049 length:996 start_codon:yes stop_codon:yes gene_type:complete